MNEFVTLGVLLLITVLLMAGHGCLSVESRQYSDTAKRMRYGSGLLVLSLLIVSRVASSDWVTLSLPFLFVIVVLWIATCSNVDIQSLRTEYDKRERKLLEDFRTSMTTRKVIDESVRKVESVILAELNERSVNTSMALRTLCNQLKSMENVNKSTADSLFEDSVKQTEDLKTSLSNIVIEKAVSSYYQEFKDDIVLLTSQERSDALYAILDGKGAKFRSIIQSAKKRSSKR